MMKKSYLISVLILFFSLSMAPSTFSLTVGTDTPKLKLSIKPGEASSGAIQVNNSGNKPVTVTAYISDWVYKSEGDGNKTFSPPATTPLSCAHWINLSTTEFELYPDEIRAVNYTVTVPNEATGGHYAIIFFESELGIQEINGMNVKIKGRVGSLVYIESEGHVIQKGEINRVNVLAPKGGDPLKINVDFINLGNVDITAKGTFHIIDQSGNIFARDKLQEMYTLPGDKVNSVTTWSGNLDKGEYDVILTYDLGKDQTLVKEAKLIIP